MLRSQKLPVASLIEFCRTLRQYLGAGLSLLDVFRQQARRGSTHVQPLATRVLDQLESGSSLSAALKPETDTLPPLVLSLVKVGEETGMLPEVFGDLEKHFVRQQKLQRQFRQQMTWPVVQLVMAIFTIAGLILILGFLPQQTPPYDPLGLGLSGVSGAMTFLTVVGLLAGALLFGWIFVRRVMLKRPEMDAFLLRVPAIGPCLRSMALTRFCMALRLTTATGMSIIEAVKLSLRATGNNAFAGQTRQASSSLRSGDELTASLQRCTVFPEEFLQILAVGEESGRLNDVLRHQADHYDEESGRRLTTLTTGCGYLLWLFIGGIIVFFIFRLFSSYVSQLQGI
jgi:type IV pilus assembly protein PilC